MQLIVTPAGGGQPVVLGFASSTQQGALNLAQLVTSAGPNDVLLLVQNGVLVGISVASLNAVLQSLSNNITMES
jgi:sulfur transfer complex TusBCD TusB component (DsrH family)